MSIIMKYHEFPERGTGSYNGVNFDVAYDWANMRDDNYRHGYSQTEAEAVGTLVYHAAASIGTQFGYSGSSAYEVKGACCPCQLFRIRSGRLVQKALGDTHPGRVRPDRRE